MKTAAKAGLLFLACLFVCAGDRADSAPPPKQPQPAKNSPQAKRGLALIKAQQCLTCHTMDGAGAEGGVSLDHMHRTRSFIIQHLLDPEASVAKNGKAFGGDPNLMPQMQLSKEEAGSIADYLLAANPVPLLQEAFDQIELSGPHPLLVQQCFMGRRELRAYIPRVTLALGDSEFNRQDLELLGFKQTAVLPVVPDLAHLDNPADWLVAGQFDDDWTNILFVGRVIANKKIEDVIRCFHAYHTRFNPRSRLIIAGVFSVFERYFAALTHMVSDLGLQHVHFAGHVSDAELIAYYELADLFLCCSEHEGFCVPLIEAFYKQIPVLAYAATAVPATMDGAGVLFDTKDPAYVAALMDGILSNPDLQDAIVDEQLNAVDRLQAKDFDRTLLGFVSQILEAPRRGAPHVAFDFWQQFDALEQLEELRRYRPSAYFALPQEPA